jgi:hypothetical protein
LFLVRPYAKYEIFLARIRKHSFFVFLICSSSNPFKIAEFPSDAENGLFVFKNSTFLTHPAPSARYSCLGHRDTKNRQKIKRMILSRSYAKPVTPIETRRITLWLSHHQLEDLFYQ